MNPFLRRSSLRSVLLACGVLLGAVLVCRGQPGGGCSTPTCLDDLARLGPCELEALFRAAEMGRPLVGVARGRLLYLTDPRMPKLKVWVSNRFWRGKAACEDCYFTNRWVGNINWIDSNYTIGPSWIDGKPAVLMEYAPGTPLFEPMHDELREVAPGLYLGPVFERFPCVKFRGWVALQMECKKRRRGCCP